MKYYLVNFHSFQSILAVDLKKEEIKSIKLIKDTMSHDDYAGYSPGEQQKWKDIKNLIGKRAIKYSALRIQLSKARNIIAF